MVLINEFKRHNTNYYRTKRSGSLTLCGVFRFNYSPTTVLMRPCHYYFEYHTNYWTNIQQKIGLDTKSE